MALNINNIPPYDIDFWKEWLSDKKELDRQLAPIHWIGDKNKRQTYDHHVNVSTAETAIARATIPCQLDVSYGTNPNKKIDIYGTDLPATAPTFFWVHGGYWRTGDRSWSAPFVRNAHSWGVRSVVVDYPLAPEVRLVDMCNGVHEALVKSLELFPHSVFIIGGHSAGAQLVATLFHAIPRVNILHDLLKVRVAGAFLISGAYDMRAIPELTFVNQALQLKRDEVDEYSALKTMDKIHEGWIGCKHQMEFFIVNAQNDPPALQKQAIVYADLLRKEQFTAEFWISSQDDHYTIVDNMVLDNSNIMNKLKWFISKVDQKRKMSKI